jgi:hypothetical protein
MKHLKTFNQLFENQPSYQNKPTGYYSAPVGYMIKGSELEEEIVDYSGEYENSRQFITENGLENEFLDLDNGVELDDYDDIEDMITDVGDDENIIGELLPGDYYMYYNSDEDEFVITKKNDSKDSDIDFKIEYATPFTSKEISSVFDATDIFIEYEPRLSVKVGDTIIGGTTYDIVEDENGKGYNFDIALLPEEKGFQNL